MTTMPTTEIRNRAIILTNALAAATSDDMRMRHVHTLEQALLQASADGKKTATLELSIPGWLSIIDEFKDRKPRNFSRLIADDTMQNLAQIVNAMDVMMQEDITRISLVVSDLELMLEEKIGRRRPSTEDIEAVRNPDEAAKRATRQSPVRPRQQRKTPISPELKHSVKTKLKPGTRIDRLPDDDEMP